MATRNSGRRKSSVTYKDRVINGVQEVAQSHGWHEFHFNQVRSQVKKDAEVNHEPLGPRAKPYINKARDSLVLEERIMPVVGKPDTFIYTPPKSVKRRRSSYMRGHTTPDVTPASKKRKGVVATTTPAGNARRQSLAVSSAARDLRAERRKSASSGVVRFQGFGSVDSNGGSSQVGPDDDMDSDTDSEEIERVLIGGGLGQDGQRDASSESEEAGEPAVGNQLGATGANAATGSVNSHDDLYSKKKEKTRMFAVRGRATPTEEDDDDDNNDDNGGFRQGYDDYQGNYNEPMEEAPAAGPSARFNALGLGLPGPTALSRQNSGMSHISHPPTPDPTEPPSPDHTALTLELELDAIRAKLAEAEGKTDELQAALTNAQRANEGLTAELERARSERINDLEERIKFKFDLEDLRSHIKQLNATLSSKNSEVTALEEMLEAHDAQISDLATSLSRAEETIVEREATIAEMTEDAASIEADLADADGELDALKQEKESLLEKLAEAEKKKAGLRAELNMSHQDYAYAMNDQLDLSATIKTLEGEKTELDTCVTMLRAELSTSTNTIKQLINNVDILKRTNAELKFHAGKSHEALRQAGTRYNELSKQTKKLRQEKDALEKTIADLRRADRIDNAKVKALVVRNIKDRLEFNKATEELKKKLKWEWQIRKDFAKSKVKEADERTAAAEAKAAAMAAEHTTVLAGLNAKLAGLEQDAAQLHAELYTQKTLKDKLDTILDDTGRNLERAQREIAARDTELVDMRGRNAELVGRVEDTFSMHYKEMAELQEQWRSDMEAARQKMAEMEAEQFRARNEAEKTQRQLEERIGQLEVEIQQWKARIVAYRRRLHESIDAEYEAMTGGVAA